MSNSIATIDTSTELDALVKAHSAFQSIDHLIEQRHNNYRPTLDVAHPERRRIADAYDAIMIAIGHPFRAYRYESPSTVKQMKALARKMAPKRVVQVGEG